MKKTTYFISLGVFVFFGLGFFPFYVLGYQIQDLEFTGPAEGDFVLGPGKTELWMESGQTITKELYITNRIGKTMDFKIEIEDFKGSADPERTVVLLGEERGPYSLKDYLHPEVSRFSLNHGERIILPVEISIPQNAEPGGLYGAVLVTTEPPETEIEAEEEKAASQVRIISRLGTLFFVRVKGEVEAEGFLQSFTTDKNFYEKGPVSFQLLFKNKGSIHLVPYGVIEIRNLFGKKIEEIELDAWFAMPDSIRERKVEWKRGLLLGRYSATVKVNRGYENIIDEKSIEFWVIPWKIILLGFVGLVVIIWFVVWVVGHFEIRRKTPLTS